MARFQSVFPEAICLCLFLTPWADVTIPGSLIFEEVEVGNRAVFYYTIKFSQQER